MSSFRLLPASLLYHWRRNNWMLDPRMLFGDFAGVPIRKPIFFLGNQGGGLTLVGRMIRRNPRIVSISGDHGYWSGPDEMQRVMELRLPKALKLARLPINVEVHHDRLTAPRSWSYASDELLGEYRKTATDYDASDAATFRRVVRAALHRYGRGRDGVRFFDKSQVYTVKLGLLNAILKDTDPYFVLVTRNPYVECHRAAHGKAIDMQRYSAFLTAEERVELCAQHWANAMACSLEDGAAVARFRTIRFEDILAEPERELQSLCDFLDLEFSPDMLPQPHHTVPRGSRFPDRWYPLKQEVNTEYLARIPTAEAQIIHRRCGALAEHFGYAPPKLTPNG